MFVYFIQATSKPTLLQIKIGLSKDPDNRLRDLQSTSPVKLTLIGTIRCKSKLHAFHVERTLHDRFKKQRRHGEWFHLSRGHLNEIEDMINLAAQDQYARKVESVQPEDVEDNYRIVHRPENSDAFLSQKFPWDY